MLAPTERAPNSRPAPLPLPSLLAGELGPAVLADDPCEAAFRAPTPTGPRKYYRARYYEPQLGRFLNEDPVRYAEGPNLYSYVDNNPTGWIDPSGLAGILMVDEAGNPIRLFPPAPPPGTPPVRAALMNIQRLIAMCSLPMEPMMYDALGRRVEKVAGGITYKYTYDGEDVLRQKENDGTSQLTRRFIHGPGVDEPWARFTGTAFTYYHADGLASVLKITNNAGTVDASYRYNAFGEIEVGQSREGYSYTGREWDPETKLYYYRARYYEPQLGRFISEDPLGHLGGDINLYAYVWNNSTNVVDPEGFAGLRMSCGPEPQPPARRRPSELVVVHLAA